MYAVYTTLLQGIYMLIEDFENIPKCIIMRITLIEVVLIVYVVGSV